MRATVGLKRNSFATCAQLALSAPPVIKESGYQMSGGVCESMIGIILSALYRGETCAAEVVRVAYRVYALAREPTWTLRPVRENEKKIEGATRFELVTYRSAVDCSTTELSTRNEC